MGAKGGLDPEVMLQAINAGSGQNGATQVVFPKSVLDRSFHYGAALHVLIKDVDLAVQQGELAVHELAALPHYHPTLAEIWTEPAATLAAQLPAPR